MSAWENISSSEGWLAAKRLAAVAEKKNHLQNRKRVQEEKGKKKRRKECTTCSGRSKVHVQGNGRVKPRMRMGRLCRRKGKRRLGGYVAARYFLSRVNMGEKL